MGFGSQEKMCWPGCGEAAQQLSLSMSLIGLHTQIAGQCRIVRNERDTLVENYQSEKNKKLSSGKVDLEREQKSTPAYPSPMWPYCHFSVSQAFCLLALREQKVFINGSKRKHQMQSWQDAHWEIGSEAPRSQPPSSLNFQAHLDVPFCNAWTVFTTEDARMKEDGNVCSRAWHPGVTQRRSCNPLSNPSLYWP